MNQKYIIPALCALMATGASADRLLHLPMEIKTGGLLEEKVSGRKVAINGAHAPENVAGAVGDALRFDGFSSFVKGAVPNGDNLDQATFSIWVAPETYPIIKHDTATTDRILMGGTLSPSSKSGWGFTLGYTGTYAFEAYSGGWKIEVVASDLLPTYE